MSSRDPDFDSRFESDDLYAALGVPAGATGEEITRAYRRLARAHHPDANPDADDDAFAGLTDAYDVLRDPDRRRRYDQTRGARVDAATAGAGTRIPVRTVGSRRQARDRDTRRDALPVEVDLPLNFEQAALGTTATVHLSEEVPCPTCDGRGTAAPAPAECPRCVGAGVTARVSGGITIRAPCPACDGSGQPPPEPCHRCSGSGTTTSIRDITVRVPAGVDDGTRLRFPGTAGQPCDAIVRIESHPYFARRGRDLTIQVPITLSEAALGAVVAVPTLDGAVAIRVPPGTPHGRNLRIAGRGIRTADGAGDLLVTIAIDVPAELNDAQRAALGAFADATGSPRTHLESRPTHVTPSRPDRP